MRFSEKIKKLMNACINDGVKIGYNKALTGVTEEIYKLQKRLLKKPNKTLKELELNAEFGIQLREKIRGMMK